jgi:hypothetical protein
LPEKPALCPFRVACATETTVALTRLKIGGREDTAKRNASVSKPEMETTMGRFNKLAMGAAAALFLAAVTPASAATELWIMGGPTPPPEARVVVKPAMPHPGMVWREGHYTWRDGKYVWMNGEWMDAPFATASWVPGHWVFHDGHNIWIEGHWEG